MRPQRVLLVCSAILALAAAPASAQISSYRIYGNEDGLSNLGPTSLLEDSKGFIWTVTENGVFRFESGEWKEFHPDADRKSGTMLGAVLGPDGMPWFYNTKGIYTSRGGQTVQLPDEVAFLQGNPIGFAANGTIWLVTTDGLFTVAKDEHVPRRVSATRGMAGGAVFVQPEGVYFACQSKICLYQNGRVQTFAGPAEWAGIITKDRDGTLWAQGHHHLMRFDKTLQQWTDVRPFGPVISDYASIAITPSGRMMTSNRSGLLIRQGETWQLLTADQGLPANQVSAVLEDSRENLWVGLSGAGIAKLLGRNRWTSFYVPSQSLDGRAVWSILRDPSGTLWAGTSSGLYAATLQPDRQAQWRQIEGLPQKPVRSIEYDPGDQSLWLSLYPEGLFNYNTKRRRLKQMNSVLGMPPGTKLERTLVDSGRRLWLATWNGVYYTPTPGGRLEHLKLTGQDTGVVCRAFSESPDHSIWIGCNDGVWQFQDGIIKRFTTAEGLLDNVVYIVTASPTNPNEVWIGYYGGLGISRLTRTGAEWKVTHLHRENGLASEIAYYLFLDKAGSLWVGHDKGVSHLINARWRHESQSDGFIWNDCNLNAYFAEPDGTLWFGTSRGISRLLPGAVEPSLEPPAVFVSNLMLGNQPAEAEQALSTDWRHSSLSASLITPSAQSRNAVEFLFSLDDDGAPRWKTTGSFLNFTQLGVGSHRLLLCARDKQSGLTGPVFTLKFDITAPFYQRPWPPSAVAGLVLFVALAVGGFARINCLRTRRKFEEAAAITAAELEHQRAAVLKQSQTHAALSKHHAQLLVNLSREMAAPVGGLLRITRGLIAKALDPDLRAQLENSEQCTEQLLMLLEHVKGLSYAAPVSKPAQCEAFSPHRVCMQLVNLLQPIAHAKSISLKFIPTPGVPEQLFGDEPAIRHIALNLLSNALHYTSRGFVNLRLNYTPPTEDWSRRASIEIDVTDSGCGMPEDKLREIESAGEDSTDPDSGLGLVIVHRLVAMLGGKLTVRSKLDIGTTFRVTVPVQLDAGNASTIAPSESRHALRILLLDETPTDAAFAASILELDHHKVFPAVTLEQALALRDSQDFDITFLPASAEAIKSVQLKGHIPCIAVSAASTLIDEVALRAAGADDFLTKPFDYESARALLSKWTPASAPKL